MCVILHETRYSMAFGHKGQNSHANKQHIQFETIVLVILKHGDSCSIPLIESKHIHLASH